MLDAVRRLLNSDPSTNRLRPLAAVASARVGLGVDEPPFGPTFELGTS